MSTRYEPACVRRLVQCKKSQKVLCLQAPLSVMSTAPISNHATAHSVFHPDLDPKGPASQHTKAGEGVRVEVTPPQHLKSSPVFLLENSAPEWQQGPPSQLICITGPHLPPSTHQGHLRNPDLWNLKGNLQAITNRSRESPWQTILLLARCLGQLPNRNLKVRSPHPTANPHPQPQENQ